ncbi:M20 family metallo-hydrolase [Nitratidesulfovibrio termitidis]|uniref:M20 family metallo-hydrolase n=1 Tax=Nitratidesulfovibrio termitidis TaxID=42252 RepID=UPI000415E782|nr:M20 family metallo-hydrolase [Nitratidesulfovibrio termitidis]
MPHRIISALDARRDAVIELQRELTSRPALGPESGGEGERAKADWLLDHLRAIGVTDIEQINAPDSRVPCGHRPNIIARVPGASPRTVWVLAHMDVVPPGDPTLWDGDPWTLRVDGDVLYGRGVEDNQQAIVSGLLVARELLEQGVTPPLSLGLAFVADEETGNARGMAHVAAVRPDLFRPDDLIVVPDFGDSDGTMIEVAEKSMLWLRVAVTGRQCHASTPDEGVNSLSAAAALILRIRHLNERFPDADPLFNPATSTFVPTKKEANVPNVNTVPGSDVFYVDCRVLPRYDLDEVVTAMRGLADEVEREHGVTIAISQVLREQAAPPTSPDAEVVTRLRAAIRDVYGVTARPAGIGGGTVAAIVRRMGLSAAVWSKLVPNAHVPNEATRVSCNIGDAKVIATMLFEGGK